MTADRLRRGGRPALTTPGGAHGRAKRPPSRVEQTMALRLPEVYLPQEQAQEVQQVLEEVTEGGGLGVWQQELSGEQTLVRVLLPSEVTEGVIDALSKRFSGIEGFRVVLLLVEASIPRPPTPRRSW